MKIIKAPRVFGVLALLVVVSPPGRAEAEGDAVPAFLDQHCLECHNAVTKKGGLDLEGLELDPAAPGVFARWVAVHDRVAAGEMPPPKAKAKRPEPADVEAFKKSLSASLEAAERDRM